MATKKSAVHAQPYGCLLVILLCLGVFGVVPTKARAEQDISSAIAERAVCLTNASEEVTQLDGEDGMGAEESASSAQEELLGSEASAYYTISSHHTGGGDVEITPSLSVNGYAVGEDVTIAAVPKEGWEFVSWKVYPENMLGPVDLTQASFSFKMPISPLSFIAEFKDPSIVLYSVTVTTDGNGDAEARPAFGATGTRVSLGATPNAWYEFAGWEVISGGVTIIDDGFTIGESDVEIKANFREYSGPLFIITFDANGGEGTMESQPFPPGASDIINRNTFTRAGATFNGWNTKPDGSGTSVKDMAKVRLSSDVTLYAQWKTQGRIYGSFIDLTSNTSHVDDVCWLINTGISEGWISSTGTRSFRPYANVARADMAAFLFRLAKDWGRVDGDWEPSGSVSFSDVSAKTAHYREIMWLAESGISQGWSVADGKKEFRPYANVARADMAAFLHRLAGLSGIKGSLGPGSIFLDVTANIAHVEDIAWLAGAGVSKGWTTPNGAEFRPFANVARADMAAFLHRLDSLR